VQIIHALALWILVGSVLLISPIAFSKGSAKCSYVASGTASWYGGKFHGRKTSSGVRFNKRALTAAHHTLPLNTWVKVTNLRNKRSVIVLINDRIGAKKHIIDVSERAAEILGFKRRGVAKVRIECWKNQKR
jgi:rare lipoprotein A